jgi:uncharacterized LabA/DUF88 family protein
MTQPSYAILIDGGFVKYSLKAAPKDPPISEQHIQKLAGAIAKHQSVQGMRLHRIYFYDAKPLTGKIRRPDGKEIDFSNSGLSKISHQQHAAIARLPYVAMRFGELSNRGWKVNQAVLKRAKTLTQLAPDDLEPNVQQKGVDMRIGLDIAALSLKKHVQLIVLVTGDSDFIPAMKFARREGVQLVLVCLGHTVKEAMLDHADVVIAEKAEDLLK